jgi:hypothetical protein
MTELRPCGTRAAYKRHLRHGEDPCDACKEAEYAPKRKGGPFKQAQCGTQAGYQRHLRLREESCAECCRTNAVAMREDRRSRAMRPDDIPHGHSGYINWNCRCPICSAAHATKLREYVARRKRREAAHAS